MSKWVWALPVALIVITAVAVALLGSRDIALDQVIYDTELSEAVSVSEADALRLLDSDRTAFDACYDAFADTAVLPDAASLPQGIVAAKADGGVLYLVLEDRQGAFAAIAKGGELPPPAESLGAEGHNISRVQSGLIGGWVYFAEYARAITFRDTYLDRLEAGLTAAQKAALTDDAIENAALILKDAAVAPFPAEYCQGKYALCAELEQTDGGTLTVILDPKTKAFLGTAE